MRSRRSARAPPKRARTSIGMAKPELTRPSRAGEPVRSNTKYDWAIICIWMAPIKNSIPNQKLRKSRPPRDTKAPPVVLVSPVDSATGVAAVSVDDKP